MVKVMNLYFWQQSCTVRHQTPDTITWRQQKCKTQEITESRSGWWVWKHKVQSEASRTVTWSQRIRWDPELRVLFFLSPLSSSCTNESGIPRPHWRVSRLNKVQGLNDVKVIFFSPTFARRMLVWPDLSGNACQKEQFLIIRMKTHTMYTAKCKQRKTSSPWAIRSSCPLRLI